MAEYKLPDTVEKDKIFIVKRSELDGRIDPFYIFKKLNDNRQYKYPTYPLYKLVKTLTGGTPSKDKIEYWNGDIFWVSPKDFKNFYINSSEDTITQLGLENSSTKLIPEDSVLMVVRSGVLIHTLPIAVNTIPVTINQDIKALIPNSNILPQYLAYYFNVFNDDILPLITKHSTTVQSVNTLELDKLEIPLPPVKEQQNIIALLDKANFVKQQKEAEAKQLLDSIDSYLLGELGITLPEKDNSLQSRIFTTQFKDITGGRVDPDYNSKYEYLVSQKSKYEFIVLKKLLLCSPQYGANEEALDYKLDTDIRYIRITDIDELGRLKPDGLKTAENTEDQYLLSYNDLLFARSGSVGRCYIHKDTTRKAIFAGYLIRFIINEKIANPDFIFYYCHSSIYKFWVSAIERPAVQSNINSEEYKSLPIPLPPIEKQNEIANHIQGIRDRAKQLQEEAIAILDKAKKEVEQMILG